MNSITWTPAPGPLFTLPETAGPISYAIQAALAAPEPDGNGAGGTPPSIERYSAAISPAQTLFDTSASASGVTISAASLAGLFPIARIDYLQHATLHTIDTWDALPAGPAELIAFKPSAARETVFTLTVTAHLSDASAHQAEYSLSVQQDWSAGRERLQEEVDARRH